MKAIGPNISRRVGCGNLAEILHNDVVMMQIAARAVENGQVLHRGGVAIFQTTVGETARFEAPAAAYRRQRVQRGPAAFLQAIQSIRAVGGGDCGKFLNLKIVRLLFDLHALSATVHTDANFAKMGGAFQVAERLYRLSKGKNAINDGTQLMGNDCTIHRLEHLARADEDTLYTDVLHQDGHGIDLSRPGQHADEADLSAQAHGPQRLAERAGAADLDDVIDAASAGQLAHFISPFGSFFIVNTFRRAELTRAF